MTARSVEPRLQDILDAIAGIRAAIGAMPFESYRESWVTRRATERGIEIISEASRHIPAALKERFPDVPWQEISSIGNILRHEYSRIDDRIIWRVAELHLDALAAAVRAMSKRE